MVKVYLNPDFTLDSFLVNGDVKIENLQHVADVDAMSVEEAFEVCQNTDGSWLNNPSVHRAQNIITEDVRSIGPGDVLEKDGEWYQIGPIGFKKI